MSFGSVEQLPGPLGAPPEPHHAAALDGRPQLSPTPSASCQGARCCHWKKLLHNLKSWSFDHCSERMKRRGSKWWFENASVSLNPSVPIILSLVRDYPLDVSFLQPSNSCPASPSLGVKGRDGWEGMGRACLQTAPFLTGCPCLWGLLLPLCTGSEASDKVVSSAKYCSS